MEAGSVARSEPWLPWVNQSTPDAEVQQIRQCENRNIPQSGYGHLFAGAYIAENLGTSTDQDWAYAQLWVNF